MLQVHDCNDEGEEGKEEAEPGDHEADVVVDRIEVDGLRVIGCVGYAHLLCRSQVRSV